MGERTVSSKGLAIRFAAIFVIMIIVIILITYVLFTYTPDLFKSLVDLIPD